MLNSSLTIEQVFDGVLVVADSSVHYHYGTKHGDPQRVDGHSGYCQSFDGADDYITSGKVLNPASGAFSAFAWVRGGGEYQHIICQMDDGANTGRVWLGVNAHGQFFTTLNASNGTSSNLNVAGDWDSSQWHHVGMVWDGWRRSLYLDGVLVARDSTIIGNLLGCNGGLYFGRNKSTDTRHFWNGEIDEVKIYRRGFSANEVAQMVAETKRWEYDTLGNRLTETDLQTGIGTSYQANSMNQYSYVDDELLKYDDNGNLELDNRNYTYTYDYENRLAEIWTTGNLIIRNSYDALGRRVMRAVHLIGENGNNFTPLRSDRYYYNDRWQIVRINTELVAGTGFSREFGYGNGIDEPLFMDLTTIEDNVAQTTRCYYIHDNLGSVVALTDASGAVVESYKYTPWGKPTIYSASGAVLTESAVENPYLFTAREVDILDSGSLKIQKNRHRDYHYILASWMQADPRGVVPNCYMNEFDPLGQYADGVNIYQYVGGEPVNRVDSWGLWTNCIGMGAERPLYPDSMKSSAHSALRSLDNFHKARVYYDTTGIGSVISKMLALNISFTGGFGATYRPVIDTVSLSGTCSESDIFHEMVHALDDKNDWYITGWTTWHEYKWQCIRAEGLAETATKLVSRSKHSVWVSLENSSTNSEAEEYWYKQWQDINNIAIGETYMVGSVTYMITSKEIGDVKTKLGVGFSCSKIKAKYDAYFKNKGICPNLVCDDIPMKWHSQLVGGYITKGTMKLDSVFK